MRLARTSGLPAPLVLCPMLVLALAGNMTFPALIPEMMELWGLSNSEAGWIASASYLSYAIVSPVAVGSTDRVDARLILLIGAVAGFVGGCGFAMFADGFWTAMVWRLFTGVSVACSYMPGLKALTDRTAGPGQGRQQSFYTASYSLGTALSMLFAGVIAEAFGWRWAFLASGLMPALGGMLVLATLSPQPPPGGHGRGGTRALPLVLRNREAMAFVLAYAGHCWELFGMRTWIVAFLVFAAGATAPTLERESIALIATFLLLLGLPASILGNELADRFGRRRALTVVMSACPPVALLLGAAHAMPFAITVTLACIYGALVMLDSAALTVGTLAKAAPESRGVTIAVQTLLASIAAVAAPLAIGVVLDLFGDGSAAGWMVAFAVISAGALGGPIALIALGSADRPARAASMPR